MAVILLDFDGTCVPKLPEPGFTEIDTGAERVLKKLINKGHKLVLWTCRNNSGNNPFNYSAGRRRTESSLEEAERWFKERDIPLYGVNGYPEEEGIVGYARKAVGDIIIDDTAVGVPLMYGNVQYCAYSTGELIDIYTYCVNWNAIEQELIRNGIL